MKQTSFKRRESCEGRQTAVWEAAVVGRAEAVVSLSAGIGKATSRLVVSSKSLYHVSVPFCSCRLKSYLL